MLGDEKDEMAQQLQDILSKLYRPPADGPRQVFALSRADAEKLPVLPSVAVISITAPERPPARIAEFTYVLRLSFADIDFLKPDLSERARGRLAQAFTSEQASVIRQFVEALPEDIRSVVIHCEGGYSRSCAVAVALHRLYGYLASFEHLSDANPSVIQVLMGEVPKHLKWKKPGR